MVWKLGVLFVACCPTPATAAQMELGAERNPEFKNSPQKQEAELFLDESKNSPQKQEGESFLDDESNEDIKLTKKQTSLNA